MISRAPPCRVGAANVLVALTRERGHNEELRHLIGERADVVEIPLTATYFRPPGEVESEIHSVRHFGRFRSLVVTSARCESYVALARAALIEAPEVFSVGPMTTRMLVSEGWTVAHESAGTALDLVDAITRGPVLLLMAIGGRVELAEALDRRQLHPLTVGCYSTRDATLDEGEQERLRHADVVFIGAPSAWTAARSLVNAHAWVLVPGVTTFEAVKAEHERVLKGWGEDFDGAWERVVSSAS